MTLLEWNNLPERVVSQKTVETFNDIGWYLQSVDVVYAFVEVYQSLFLLSLL
jgi:hypothetical protein